MKLLFLPVVISVLGLVGCQSGGMSAAESSSRNVEVAGGQSRYSVSLPENTPAAPAPYALQGTAPETPAMASGNGYQAREELAIARYFAGLSVNEMPLGED